MKIANTHYDITKARTKVSEKLFAKPSLRRQGNLILHKSSRWDGHHPLPSANLRVMTSIRRYRLGFLGPPRPSITLRRGPGPLPAGPDSDTTANPGRLRVEHSAAMSYAGQGTTALPQVTSDT